MKIIPEKHDTSRDFINLSIVLAITLCIGVYLIVTTSIIAKDGVVFIEYARELETAPVKTMLNEFQHPGYPWLILAAHRTMGGLRENMSVSSWICCAQGIALMFRLLAITMLYFIGKHLLSGRLSFWAVLILVLLPVPAKFGSDALSDWPHLFFLSAGILLLLKGAVNERRRLFGLAGLAAGVGYLVRPECVQLVAAGGLWLAFQLLWSKRTMSKIKTLTALVLMLAGFLAAAWPYMNLKGAIFPKKNVGQFIQSTQQPQVDTGIDLPVSEVAHASEFTLSNITKAIGKLAENTGETLAWFFVPALLLGMYKWFKGRNCCEPESFFVITLIAINVAAMIWLYCRHDYMSRRHTLPLLILPILCVPVGLQESAVWLRGKFSGKLESTAAINRSERFWFVILLIIGISICIPKLFTPIRMKQQGYRAAAQWLKVNTDAAATIAVPDKRINFYAQRQGPVYEDGHIPTNTVYTVRILKNQKEETVSAESPAEIEYEYVDKREKGVDVVIYKNLQRR